jgi:hypothetical protein
MRVPLGGFFGLAVLLTLTVPAQAEYLLNCRLMNPSSPDYKRYCVGNLSYVDCSPQGVCIAKMQNFKSAYSTEDTGANEANKSPSGSLIGGRSSATGNIAGGALSGVSGSSVAGAAKAAGGLIGNAGSTVGSALGRVTP